jgi:predicted phage-related endonuclease
MTDSRAARGTYIGGHDAVAIDGSHPFLTIVDVWAKLTGRDKRDISMEPPIVRGRIVEPGLLDEVERRTGAKLVRDVWCADDVVPYFGGTLDAIADRTMIEVTSGVSMFIDGWGPSGDPDGVCNYKYLQVQWYFGLPVAKHIDVATVYLFVADTGEFRSYPVERNQAVIDRLRSQSEAFYMEHVAGKKPISVDWSTVKPEAYERALGFMYSGRVGASPLTTEMAEAARAFDVARAAAKEAEDAKARARNDLIALLRDTEKASGDVDGTRITVSYTKRAGTPTTDTEGLIGDLARRAKLSDVELGDIRRSFTSTPEGYRALLVKVKPSKE